MSYFLLILGLFVMIAVHEWGHLMGCKLVKIHATRYYIGFGRAIIKWKHKDVEYGLAPILLGGYVKIPGMIEPDREEDRKLVGAPHATDSELMELLPGDKAENYHPQAYWRSDRWRRAVVILAGPAINIITGILLLIVSLAYFTPVYNQDVKVTQAVAPLHVGDKITRWQGADTTKSTWYPRDGKNIPLTIVRNNTSQDVILPTTDKIVIERSGKVRDKHFAHQPLGQSISRGFHGFWLVTTSTVKGVGQIFYSPEARHQVSSIVGIVGFAPQAYDGGFLLQFLAILSISIALFNLLPLLPLDGGHLVVIIIETIRRRPLTAIAQLQYSALGLLGVLALFMMGLYNDLH